MRKVIIFFSLISFCFSKEVGSIPKNTCDTKILEKIVNLINNIIEIRNKISKNLTLTYLLGYYPFLENITISNLNCSSDAEYDTGLKISLFEKYKVTSPDIKISKRKNRLFYRISIYKFFEAMADSIFQNYGQYITNLNITLYIYDGSKNKYIPGCNLVANYDNYLSGSYNIVCRDDIFLFCKKEYEDIKKKRLKQNQKKKEDKNV